MALPYFPRHAPSRSRILADRVARQREQDERSRRLWERHARYFREQHLRGEVQAAWVSCRSFQQSMSAYCHDKLKEEKRCLLEKRRDRLRTMLLEEQDQLEAELFALIPDKSSQLCQMMQKSEEIRTAREERKKKVAQELLKEHWKRNTPELRQVESALHQDYVVNQWQEQICEKRQNEATQREEHRRFENEYERTRKEALARMKQAEEKKREEEMKRAGDLCKQMEELKLREEEATRLKKEQEILLLQQLELEKLEDERKRMEERKKKCEMRHFLIRQYRAQLKRKAQQVQEELESDRKILAALLEAEQEDTKLETERRERAIADAAWMKHVIEEQLALEREREAEFETLHREEAQRMWQRREAQWDKERKARERLMQEVLLGRQQQLELKMQKNREAQEGSLKRREELIKELEREKELLRQEREQEECRKAARMQDIKCQMEQRHQKQLEKQQLLEEEVENERKALEAQEQQLNCEMQKMVEKGYQEKIHCRTRAAWT